MKTMKEIDVWYESEIHKAKLEGKIETALSLLRENVSLEIVSRTTGITIDRNNFNSHQKAIDRTQVDWQCSIAEVTRVKIDRKI